MSDYHIQNKSEEIQEILVSMPAWVIRWGITTILIVVSILLAISWYIKYPDIISADVTITSSTPPVKLHSRIDGLIDFKIKDGEKAQKGDIIAMIKNSAKSEDIFYLQEEVNKIKNLIYSENLDKKVKIKIKSDLNVGTVQSSYLAFLSSLGQLRLEYEKKIINYKINSFKKRKKNYENLSRQIQSQIDILKEETEISKSIYIDDSILYSKGAGIKIEKKQSKTKYLGQKRSLESLKASLIENQLSLSQLESEISLASLQNEINLNELNKILIQDFEKLENQLRKWRYNNTLESPINGKISLSKYWADNQYVQSGEEVLSLVSPTKELLGIISLPIKGAGKVLKGQKVIIKLDNYPYREYGYINSEIKSISLVPRDNVFRVVLNFPQGLKSNYSKELKYQHNMKGTAEIITSNRNLLERIFKQFYSLI